MPLLTSSVGSSSSAWSSPLGSPLPEPSNEAVAEVGAGLLSEEEVMLAVAVGSGAPGWMWMEWRCLWVEVEKAVVV